MLSIFKQKKEEPIKPVGYKENPRPVEKWDYLGNYNTIRDGAKIREVMDSPYRVVFGYTYITIINDDNRLAIRFKYAKYNIKSVDLLSMSDLEFKEYIMKLLEDK